MKKRRWAMLLAVGMVMAMTACGGTSGESAASEENQAVADEKTDEKTDAKTDDAKAADADLKFAYVVRDTGSIYSQYITDFEEACAAEGVEPVIISWEGDTAKWPDALENAVTVGADAVYSWPNDQAMADYAADYYASMGVPHCVMGIETEKADCCLLGDQKAMGEALAEQVAAWVEENLGDESFEWALLEFTSASHVAERSQAMEDTVTELCPNGTQVAALEAQSLEEGMEQTENLLQQHPDVQVLVCCEDTAAMGAVEVFRAAGKTGDDYAIFGACFGDQVGNAILKGDVYRESIAFDKFGPYVVKALKTLCEAGTVDHDIYGGFIPVTQDNVKEVMEMFDYEIVE